MHGGKKRRKKTSDLYDAEHNALINIFSSQHEKRPLLKVSLMNSISLLLLVFFCFFLLLLPKSEKRKNFQQQNWLFIIVTLTLFTAEILKLAGVIMSHASQRALESISALRALSPTYKRYRSAACLVGALVHKIHCYGDRLLNAFGLLSPPWLFTFNHSGLQLTEVN